jgi:hypothetical protein
MYGSLKVNVTLADAASFLREVEALDDVKQVLPSDATSSALAHTRRLKLNAPFD